VSVRDKEEGEIPFTLKFLNLTRITDLPLYKKKLKDKTMIMPMRNLDISVCLCIGTFLVVTELDRVKKNVVLDSLKSELAVLISVSRPLPREPAISVFHTPFLLLLR